MKKVLSVLLSFVLILTASPVFALSGGKDYGVAVTGQDLQADFRLRNVMSIKTMKTDHVETTYANLLYEHIDQILVSDINVGEKPESITESADVFVHAMTESSQSPKAVQEYLQKAVEQSAANTKDRNSISVALLPELPKDKLTGLKVTYTGTQTKTVFLYAKATPYLYAFTSETAPQGLAQSVRYQRVGHMTVTTSDQLPFSTDIIIDEENFPDESFRDYIKQQFDHDKDGRLREYEIEHATSIFELEESINDLSGIRFFPYLDEIYGSFDQMTSLNLEDFSKLHTLTCSNGMLSSLNVKNCLKLYDIDCSHNRLTELDLTGCTNLSSLDCSDNLLSHIDVTDCPNLKTVSAAGNRYPIILDENGCFSLSELPDGFDYAKTRNWVGGKVENGILTVNEDAVVVKYDYEILPGQFETFTFTFDHGDVPMDEAHFPDRYFRDYVARKFDTNQDGVLNYDEIMAVKNINQAEDRDAGESGKAQNIRGISYFTVLEKLYWKGSDALTEFDVSKNAALTHLSITGSGLTALDVSSNRELKYLNCQYNRLTKLELGSNKALCRLDCSNNQLTSLQADGLTSLGSLYCFDNQLTALKLQGCTELWAIKCANNRLTELDLSSTNKLKHLDCANNRLLTLNLGNNVPLSHLDYANNRLTSTAVATYRSSGNRFPIKQDQNGQFALSQLPDGFDYAKTSNWVGGTVTNGILTANPNTIAVTYDYLTDKSRIKITFTLLKDRMSLTKGQSYRLNRYFDAGTVWKISDPSVIAIDEAGTLKALQQGTATISTMLYGEIYTCKVTVSNKAYTVQRGDTLWGIAARELGSGYRYKEIMEMNGLTSTLIHRGKKMYLPA